MERYGTPDVLELRDVATPIPGPHEVLVRVRAASLNDWDVGMLDGSSVVNRLISGLFSPKARVPGCDFAGRIEAVGEEVERFRPGDDVYGDLSGHGFGAFAEYVCAPEAGIALKPTAMSFERAAAIPQAGMLAVQGLIDAGEVRSGQKVLLNGAGGGVGTFALQIAKLHGAEVTVVDRIGKLAMLEAMGADHVIDYREEDFTKSGRRYDLILDVKTDRSPFAYARALEAGGRYVTVGGDMAKLLQVLVAGPVASRLRSKRLRIVALKPNKELAYVNELFEAGRLEPVIDRRFELARVPDAYRYFSTGEHRGKIVITVA